MNDADLWATAYARQARADFATWNELQGNAAIPSCHKLMFLQMACEKLCKARLCKAGANPADLQASHAYIEKNLPIIIRQQVGLSRPKNATWTIEHARHLAREIELLSPAVRRGGKRVDNCEYPWRDEQGLLHVPVDHDFTPARLLTAPAGRTFLKLIREAIDRFLKK